MGKLGEGTDNGIFEKVLTQTLSLQFMGKDIAHLLAEYGVVLARTSDRLRQCPSCHIYFVPYRDDHTYCKRSCRQISYDAKSRAEREKYR